MKLQVFNAEEFKNNKGVPSIRFNKSSGSKGNVLSSALKELLGINQTGDCVQFALDPARPKDLYIRKDKEGFKLNKSLSSFHSTSFSKRILINAGVEGEAATFKVSESPVVVDGLKWYPIITSNPIKVKTISLG